jgi:hypothetical protein
MVVVIGNVNAPLLGSLGNRQVYHLSLVILQEKSDLE